MIGAIIGDIVGSRFEWNPLKSKQFELFNSKCKFTDDTVMTCAIAKSFNEWIDSNKSKDLKSLFIKNMQELGLTYPNAGYGGMFGNWLMESNPQPYNSFGNGSAMRVSPCGWVANSLQEAMQLSKLSAEVTHNHKEGIKGAQATACAIFLARNKTSKQEIKKYIQDNFKYNLNFNLNDIRDNYNFDVTCQGSVPQAIVCFLESKDYEDCIRNAISLGGDSDTIGAIAGSIAEAYYGINKELIDKACSYLDKNLISIYKEFKDKFVR